MNLCCRYTFEKSAYYVLDCAQSVLEDFVISEFHVFIGFYTPKTSKILKNCLIRKS